MHDTYDTADEMVIIDYNIQPPEDHVGYLPDLGYARRPNLSVRQIPRTRGHSLVQGIPPYLGWCSLEQAFL